MYPYTPEIETQPFNETIMTDEEFVAFMQHHNSGRGEDDE